MTQHTNQKLIRKKYEIFDQKIGKDSPDRFKFTTKEFSKIHYAELRIQIGANKPSGIPLVSWKLTKFILNNFTFFPSSPTNSVNVVHTSTLTCPDHKNCVGQHLKANGGENIILVFHDAPFFAGLGETFTPDISMHGELLVVGEQQINPVVILGSGVTDFENNLEKIADDFGTLYKRNLPLAIFITIVILIIVVAVAYILFRVGGVTHDVATTSQAATHGT